MRSRLTEYVVAHPQRGFQSRDLAVSLLNERAPQLSLLAAAMAADSRDPENSLRFAVLLLRRLGGGESAETALWRLRRAKECGEALRACCLLAAWQPRGSNVGQSVMGESISETTGASYWDPTNSSTATLFAETLVEIAAEPEWVVWIVARAFQKWLAGNEVMQLPPLDDAVRAILQFPSPKKLEGIGRILCSYQGQIQESTLSTLFSSWSPEAYACVVCHFFPPFQLNETNSFLFMSLFAFFVTRDLSAFSLQMPDGVNSLQSPSLHDVDAIPAISWIRPCLLGCAEMAHIRWRHFFVILLFACFSRGDDAIHAVLTYFCGICLS